MKHWPLLCLALFQAPDGTTFILETSRIVAVRPVTDNIKEHLSRNARALLYVDGQKFAVVETPEQAAAKIEHCGQ